MPNTTSPNTEFMLAAIDCAKQDFNDESGGPFGACVVKNDQIISVAHNTVLAENDPTCHAEINAIRLAAKALGTYDLSGCEIYSTTEPCPMCFSAIHWAKIDRIIFGSRIADVQALGFNELEISNLHMKNVGKSPLEIIPDFMHDECVALLQSWQANTGAKTY